MKNIGIVLLIFVALVGLNAGCKETTGGGDGSDTTKVDSIVFDPSPECADLPPKHFCWAGLDFIMLGDSLTWKEYPAPEGGVFKDTVFSDTTKGEAGDKITDWNVRMLKFASGTVYLEADFEVGFLLNRLRIETPEYKLKNGISVGSTADQVRKAYAGEALLATPFEEYGVMELIRPIVVGNTRRTVIFHFPLGRWYQAGQSEYTPESIAGSALVSRIVIM